MKKIKTVFRIDRELKIATSEIIPENQWVIDGEGVATIKYDGTAALIRNGKLYRRYDRKLQKSYFKKLKSGLLTDFHLDMFKPAPEGFEPCENAPDKKTGHWPGWVPVSDLPENRWFIEAFSNASFADGTYELVGPKVQSNQYALDAHELWMHGRDTVQVERSFEAIKDWLSNNRQEGIVFHHEDGRMAKIRRKDFQLPW